MYIDGKPVLHVIDQATAFQAACFLDEGMSAKSAFAALEHCWMNVYVGPSE